MAENVPDPLRRNASIHAVFESLALLLGLVVVAVTIMADSTFHQLAALISFVVVFFLAKTLFERLGNVPGPAVGTFPKFVNSAVTFAIGIAMLFGLDWIIEYAGRIGVGVAMVFGFLAAYLAVAWRQRWYERRIYRQNLLRPS